MAPIFKHVENYFLAGSLFAMGASEAVSSALHFFSAHEVEIGAIMLFATMLSKKVIEIRREQERLKQERIRTKDLEQELKDKQNL